MSDFKSCPHCAEKDLQLDAKVCKHCGKELEKNSSCVTITVFGCLAVIGCIFIATAGFMSCAGIVAIGAAKNESKQPIRQTASTTQVKTPEKKRYSDAEHEEFKSFLEKTGANSFIKSVENDDGTPIIVVKNNFFSQEKQVQLQLVQALNKALRGITKKGYAPMRVVDVMGNRVAGVGILGDVQLY